MVMEQAAIAGYFMELQDAICLGLEKEDGAGRFRQDNWLRSGGGGGRSRIMQDGALIEKGGVNFSEVHGEIPPGIRQEFGGSTGSFYATGLSLVLHPRNPFVPIIHMNVRYFGLSEGTWWFGGGMDLTPHYIVSEDAAQFHRMLQNICMQYDPAFYDKFKDWADQYFYIAHRDETRGVGGIFFDRLNTTSGHSFEQLFAFIRSVGDAFLPAYLPLAAKNRDTPYGDRHRKWQLLRRGRYAEFNLVYDRGTRFGLETGGRTESILMSLPPLASWEYDHKPESGTPEVYTLQMLKKGIKWAEIL